MRGKISPTLINAAKEQFKPVSDEQVQAAQANLQKQAEALERFVRPRSANGKQWLSYLKWDDFQTALHADGKVAFDPLVATYNRLNQDQTGLDLKQFRAVSAALRHYIDIAAMARQQDQAETYRKQLDALAKELDAYASTPTESTSAAIGRRLDLLAGLGKRRNWWPPCARSFRIPMRSSPCRLGCSATQWPNRSTATSR